METLYTFPTARFFKKNWHTVSSVKYLWCLLIESNNSYPIFLNVEEPRFDIWNITMKMK